MGITEIVNSMNILFTFSKLTWLGCLLYMTGTQSSRTTKKTKFSFQKLHKRILRNPLSSELKMESLQC